MFEDLITIHREVMHSTALQVKRYLYNNINWSAKAICILGDRGVGKTTLMCQYLLENFGTVERALYIRPLSKLHLLVKIVFFGTFIAKFFGHMPAYALKIYH